MNQENKYLTTRNVLWALGSFILIVFLLPSGGVFYRSYLYSVIFPVRFPFLLIYCGLEMIVLSAIWSFPAIVKRRWKKAAVMSIMACGFYTLTLVLQYYSVTGDWFILFINPVAWSICAGLMYGRKYRLAVLGYGIGVLFSFGPLIFSVVPILFMQLFLSEYPIQPQSKSQSFFSRIVPYYIIGMGFLFFSYINFSNPQPVFHYIEIANPYFPIIVSGLYILTGYLSLRLLLKAYYHPATWKYALAYIPCLWTLPQICILFEKNTSSNLIKHESS